MDKKRTVIDASMKSIMDSFPKGGGVDYWAASFRHFSEHVIGISIERLMPHFASLMQMAVSGACDPNKVRLSKVHGEHPALQVSDDTGNWFAVSWRSRKDVDSGDDESPPITDVSLFAIDPENPDYPYPDLVASGTLVEWTDRTYSRGHSALENFGKAVDALRAFVVGIGVSTPEIDPEEVHGDDMMKISYHNDILAFDGGVVGAACREVGIRTSRLAALAAMSWADKTMPSVVDGLVKEGVTWGVKCLEYNDLDNNVCLLPPGSNGESSIIHRNSSYISDYRTYVLSKRTDGVLALYALKDGTDDFDRVRSAICEGVGTAEPIVVLDKGEISMKNQFDVTCVVDAMAHGLKFTREVVVDGDRGDANYQTDLSIFDTKPKEDIDLEDVHQMM